MNNLLKPFLPNQPTTKQTTQLILGFWVVFSLILWVFSPFKFLPTPIETYLALKELWSFDNLDNELFISIKLNIETILLSTVISLGLAYINTISFFKPFVSFIGKLRFVSMVGLVFFFTLMVSNGFQLRLSILTFSVVVFFVTGMVDVINGIDQAQYDLAKTLRMGPWQELYEIVILGQADKAFEVLRQNAAMGWAYLTLVECLDRSGGGIGGILMDMNKHFHLAAVLAIELIMLSVGLGQDKLITFLRSYFCRYADLERSR